MAGSSTAEPQPVLYYDVGSPWCWLAGERAHEVLGTVPVWQPVSLGPLGEVNRAAVERRARSPAASSRAGPAPRGRTAARDPGPRTDVAGRPPRQGSGGRVAAAAAIRRRRAGSPPAAGAPARSRACARARRAPTARLG